jgi:hypothetical protein
VSLQHLDGHEMTTVMAWAQEIVTLQPESAAYVADANPLFKIHMRRLHRIRPVLPVAAVLTITGAIAGSHGGLFQ